MTTRNQTQELTDLKHSTSTIDNLTYSGPTPKNSDRFLGAFTNIEQHLRKELNVPVSRGYHALIDLGRESNPTVRRSAYDLKKYGDLRNAIVHESSGGQAIAEPHDSVVRRIEQLAELITKPPEVIPEFQANVLTLCEEDSIARAAETMFSSNFSQIPIYSDDLFQGLLTGTTVARWLGARASEDVFSLNETPIQEVLQYAEYPYNYEFIHRHTTLPEVIECFHSREGVEEALEALLISHSGKPNEQLLGIVTAWDLPRVHQALST